MVQSDQNRMGAFLLIGLGVLFLAGQVFNFDLGNWIGNAWPLLIVGVGALFLAVAVFGGRNAAGFVFPGAVIAGTGMILTYQNNFDHWESWAYAWALYPVFVGAALIFHGQRTGKGEDVRAGRGAIIFGLIALVIGWVFFELLIFQGSVDLLRYLLPGVLILSGLSLLFKRGERDKVKNS